MASHHKPSFPLPEQAAALFDGALAWQQAQTEWLVRSLQQWLSATSGLQPVPVRAKSPQHGHVTGKLGGPRG
ncbi:hypothetical protein [Ramlibacter humi]|uniref:Uncharacterized protein n=1 Tax=Ramlibacter humi TaxID=2530451 RepID=A0A4Z0BV53_9BURK|nr:hypothetical protein [Ramlibacter humi]TFZ01905.1 hypothetical protein EZ216_12000 [Ramlibacter humi]